MQAIAINGHEIISLDSHGSQFAAHRLLLVGVVEVEDEILTCLLPIPATANAQLLDDTSALRGLRFEYGVGGFQECSAADSVEQRC
jgi:hypothetical protein